MCWLNSSDKSFPYWKSHHEINEESLKFLEDFVSEKYYNWILIVKEGITKDNKDNAGKIGYI